VANVIDQDVDHSESGDRLPRGVPVGDIECGSGHLEPVITQAHRRGAQRGRVPPVDDDFCARAREAASHLQP